MSRRLMSLICLGMYCLCLLISFLRIVNTTFVGWFLLVILEPMNVDYIILLHLLLCRC